LKKETIDLTEYYYEIKKNFRWIMLWVITFTLLSAIFTFYIQDPVYESKAQLLVHEIHKEKKVTRIADIDSQIKLIPTYSEIIVSPAVLKKAESHLNIDRGKLENQITIYTNQESQIITIKVENENPKRAANIANSVAHFSIEEIKSTLSMNNLNIITKATVNDHPIRPVPILNIGIAFLFSLFIGIVWVCVARLFSSRFHHYLEIKHALNLPLMGVVGEVKPIDSHQWEKKESRAYIYDKHPLYQRLITRWPHSSADIEAYRKLMTSLLLMQKEKNLSSIALTAPTHQSGTTLTAGNLAVLLAQSGKKTVYMETNYLYPSAHKMFSISSDKGSSSLIKSEKTFIPYTIHPTFHSRLDFVTLNKELENNSHMLNSEHLSLLMEEFKKKYEYIILDCPAIDDSANSLLWSHHADGVILVVDYRQEDMNHLSSCHTQLEEFGTDVFGVFVNRYRS
jgi:polysaccharide biosynthesis transport protein